MLSTFKVLSQKEAPSKRLQKRENDITYFWFTVIIVIFRLWILLTHDSMKFPATQFLFPCWRGPFPCPERAYGHLELIVYTLKYFLGVELVASQSLGITAWWASSALKQLRLDIAYLDYIWKRSSHYKPNLGELYCELHHTMHLFRHWCPEPGNSSSLQLQV